MSRAAEIELSRSSSGEFTGKADPLTLSLYNFAIDSDTLKPEHQAVLSELGRLLSARATVPTMVRAVGFTDSTGSEVHNLVLSEQRAVSVRGHAQKLASQRITISDPGDTNPEASNATVSGRSRNRRVDLRFATEPPAPSCPDRNPGPSRPGLSPRAAAARMTIRVPPYFPNLCGIGVLPLLPPLICLIAPEACAAIGCCLAPELRVRQLRHPDSPSRPKSRPTLARRTSPSSRRARLQTPVGMADRIGLRDPVQVMAVVVAPIQVTTPITVDVDGVSALGGNATVNGGADVQIMGTTPLAIRGVAMMRPVSASARSSSSAPVVGHSGRGQQPLRRVLDYPRLDGCARGSRDGQVRSGLFRPHGSGVGQRRLPGSRRMPLCRACRRRHRERRHGGVWHRRGQRPGRHRNG